MIAFSFKSSVCLHALVRDGMGDMRAEINEFDRPLLSVAVSTPSS